MPVTAKTPCNPGHPFASRVRAASFFFVVAIIIAINVGIAGTGESSNLVDVANEQFVLRRIRIGIGGTNIKIQRIACGGIRFGVTIGAIFGCRCMVLQM
jgi:hypothetical protein